MLMASSTNPRKYIEKMVSNYTDSLKLLPSLILPLWMPTITPMDTSDDLDIDKSRSISLWWFHAMGSLPSRLDIAVAVMTLSGFHSTHAKDI
jgi:hypothetical protein